MKKTNSAPNKKVLPPAIEAYIDKNILFNKFGLVNMGAVMASTGITMDKQELKQLIIERFGAEFAPSEIEFLDKDI
jgi:hypothetical protein